MELNEQHISSYLPHDVYCYIQGHKDEDDNPIMERVLGIYDKNDVSVTLDDNDSDNYYIEDIYLILRPLSDLTKDEFVSIWEHETDLESIEQCIETSDFETNKFSYLFWQLLFQNHFDIFGLIEKGLAIDINTIKL